MSDAVSERDLQQLETELRRLEGEYNMYFAGRVSRPPWETRRRVEAIITRVDHEYIQNLGLRFRFSTLQARYASFSSLWDRAFRAREEGRVGPFATRRPEPDGVAAPPAPAPDERTVFVAAFRDPLAEMEKLHEMYDSLVDARHELGLEPVPFHRFVDLVKQQVTVMKAQGTSAVTFRVTVREGQVTFTARATEAETTE